MTLPSTGHIDETLPVGWGQTQGLPLGTHSSENRTLCGNPPQWWDLAGTEASRCLSPLLDDSAWSQSHTSEFPGPSSGKVLKLNKVTLNWREGQDLGSCVESGYGKEPHHVGVGAGEVKKWKEVIVLEFTLCVLRECFTWLYIYFSCLDSSICFLHFKTCSTFFFFLN